MSENWHNGNTVKLLINGEEFFPQVFASLREAQQEILLETFIIAEDKIGLELQRELIAAARRGVRVEVMVDDYGTFNLSAEFVAALVEAGVNLHVFDPAPRTLGMRTNIFRRLHRKIVVIDGAQAFVGGINFTLEHVAEYGPMAKQDYAVQVRGPIVNDIHQASVQLLRTASIKKNRNWKNFVPPENQPAGDVRMLLAIRDNNKHTSDIEKLYLRAIRLAKQRIVIANAYFFPGYRLLRALRNAARRGLEVTLILQGQPDMPWVSACSRLLYNYLIKEGVKIYEYCERPLHGKVAVIDSQWVTVGSSNLDPLSLAMNLEANLFIENKPFNQQFYQHLKDLTGSSCKPITLQIAKRGYWWRLPIMFLSFHFLRYFPAIAGWLPARKPVLKPMRPEDLKPAEHTTPAEPATESWQKNPPCDREKTV